LNRLKFVVPILVVVLILSLFGCGGGSATPSEGLFGTKWGASGSGHGEFIWPWDIAVAPDGSVYVLDPNNDRIQKFTAEGVFVSKWGEYGKDDGQFSEPERLAVATDGSVYVAGTQEYRLPARMQGVFFEGRQGRIQKFTSVLTSNMDTLDGVFVSKWDTDGDMYHNLGHLADIDVGPDGSVYFISRTGVVDKYTYDGVSLANWGTGGSGDGEFIYPPNIAVAPDGSVYVTDYTNHRIQKFTSEGVFVAQWGTTGEGDGEFGEFGPTALAVAFDGSVYAADETHRIQKFTSEGVFVAKWGTTGEGDGQFNRTSRLAVGPDGSVYVLDPGNNRIQKFLPGK